MPACSDQHSYGRAGRVQQGIVSASLDFHIRDDRADDRLETQHTKAMITFQPKPAYDIAHIILAVVLACLRQRMP